MAAIILINLGFIENESERVILSCKLRGQLLGDDRLGMGQAKDAVKRLGWYSVKYQSCSIYEK